MLLVLVAGVASPGGIRAKQLFDGMTQRERVKVVTQWPDCRRSKQRACSRLMLFLSSPSRLLSPPAAASVGLQVGLCAVCLLHYLADLGDAVQEATVHDGAVHRQATCNRIIHTETATETLLIRMKCHPAREVLVGQCAGERRLSQRTPVTECD